MEWIKCSDRMPKDKYEYVLACYVPNIPQEFIGFGSSKFGTFTHVHYHPDQKKWGQWLEGNFVLVPGEVTHWMPLPEPPKE